MQKKSQRVSVMKNGLIAVAILSGCCVSVLPIVGLFAGVFHNVNGPAHALSALMYAFSPTLVLSITGGMLLFSSWYILHSMLPGKAWGQ
jgi:hypothetical protein